MLPFFALPVPGIPFGFQIRLCVLPCSHQSFGRNQDAVVLQRGHCSSGHLSTSGHLSLRIIQMTTFIWSAKVPRLFDFALINCSNRAARSDAVGFRSSSSWSTSWWSITDMNLLNRTPNESVLVNFNCWNKTERDLPFFVSSAMNFWPMGFCKTLASLAKATSRNFASAISATTDVVSAKTRMLAKCLNNKPDSAYQRCIHTGSSPFQTTSRRTEP